MVLYRVPQTKRRRTFSPGHDRVGGFYGRYSGRDAELKFFNTTPNDAVVATGFDVISSVNLIAQGITENTRIGRKCTIKHIAWRYTVSLPEIDAQATAGPNDTIRVVLFVDKQCNGATATGPDIFEIDQYQSFTNLANQNRFRILHDRTVTLSYTSLASDGAGVVSSSGVRKDYIFNKSCSIPLEFSDVTGAITEVRSNNIGIAIGGDTGVAGFISRMRLRFSDGS